jgi:hypothetical protein
MTCRMAESSGSHTTQPPCFTPHSYSHSLFVYINIPSTLQTNLASRCLENQFPTCCTTMPAVSQLQLCWPDSLCHTSTLSQKDLTDPKNLMITSSGFAVLLLFSVHLMWPVVRCKWLERDHVETRTATAWVITWLWAQAPTFFWVRLNLLGCEIRG